MAGFYGWVAATTSATLSYGVISAQMVVYGLGMGLTSAHATESIIGALVAGGVAAVGALLAVLFLPAQPAAQPAQLTRPAQPAAQPAQSAAQTVAED